MSFAESKINNVATFVYEGVKSLSRHVSSSSECFENSKEDFLSQSSTSIENQENLEEILNSGTDLLNREVWMFGYLDRLPIIIPSLSNLGVEKVSLQGSHCCALTLDGRVFIWGQNTHHQVTMENNADQILPKKFQNNSNERISDAVCGNNFTVILSNNNLKYFGKGALNYQTKLMNSSNNGALLVHKEFVLLNHEATLDEDFCTKEQINLEEMLLVHQNVIKFLLKKSSLYEDLCKCYIDLMNYLAANVKSLLTNDILIIKHLNEFILVYKNYVKVVQDVLCVNGLENVGKWQLLLNPLKNLSHYKDFYKKHSTKEAQTKWQELIDFVDFKSKESAKTLRFWQNNQKIDFLKKPNRRFILDSLTDPINLQNPGIFTSNRFLLFSDIFAHIIGSSNNHLHYLATIWIWLDSSHNICLKMPEEALILTAPDAATKNKWFHSMQNAIKDVLDKSDLFQPPLVRNGAYTFTKGGFFKDGAYSGRWLNAKMHGPGKIKWPDGRMFNGQFEHNFLSFGLMETPNVGSYEGEWKNNKPHGHGTFSYCNGDIYKGFFKEGNFHGHGLLQKGNFMANSASLYIGEWDSGKKCGYGIMDDISTGEKYLGFWANCKKEGNGSIVTSEGTYYEGNFHNDALLGHGIMVLEDGCHYEGEFKGTGLIGGKGALTLPAGYKIEGFLSGSIDQGIKINQGIFRKKTDRQSFGKLCTAPDQKWRALFGHCQQILGDSEEETAKIWQNVAVYLTMKNHRDDKSNSLENLDVIPPFGKDKITLKSFKEIKTYLNRAFASNLHPLGNLLENLCEAFVASYSGKIHSILVNQAILEIIDLTQRIYEIVRYLFPALPSEEFTISDEIVINYQSLLYPIILPKIYNCLCTLLNLKHESQEKKYKNILIEWNKLPDKNLMNLLCVEKKFWIENSIFTEAIETLQQMISVFLPQEKLLVIRKTVEKMTPIAKNLLGNNYIWNMDDLFPLFLFVVVKARIPNLGAELEFMEHFMDESMENGELGIIFTTLKACYQQILQDKSHFDTQ